MRKTRRFFVFALAATAGSFASPRGLLPGQRITPPPPPAPAETQLPIGAGHNAAAVDSARRALLIRNEREFRAGIEQLYQLASDLRNEVEKTITSDVLSVRTYKKTEAIEKLAKQLKNKAKG